MKVKKIPQRTCIGCGEIHNKKEMVRIVRSPEGAVSLDRSGKKPGRGAYVCPNAGCIEKTFQSKSLERALQVKVSPETKEALLAELSHENGQ
ncbi:RNase P modulator RnpM [Acidaminococcus fermentans]|uniref:RNase P modulator RnpM n=1 Tax=Acidaminococcus fermentans TaxID=905 RepID=UPI00242B3FDA|nr:YlxR family protein [Acidaminococcus fermentans]